MAAGGTTPRLLVEKLKRGFLRLNSTPLGGSTIGITFCFIGPERVKNDILDALFIPQGKQISTNTCWMREVHTLFGGSWMLDARTLRIPPKDSNWQGRLSPNMNVAFAFFVFHSRYSNLSEQDISVRSRRAPDLLARDLCQLAPEFRRKGH